MKQPVNFTLDGKQYTVSPYVTSYGMRLLTEIFLLLGEPLVQLAMQAKDAASKGGMSALMDLDIKPETVSAIMLGLTSRMQPDTMDSLFQRILVNTLIAGGSQTAAQAYETHFMGEYAHLFKVVMKTLQAQYGDFSSALGGLAGFASRVGPK